MDDRSDIEYLDTLRPLNLYGYSKQLFDQYASRSGLLEKIAGVKFFNVFGPNERHKGSMRSLVHKAYEQVRDTGKLKLFRSYRPDYADGEQKRDFVFVGDAVAMTLHLATSNANGLYNVGSGRAETWLELAIAVFGAMNREAAIEFIDMPVEMREKYQYFTRADIGRVRQSGYSEPVTSLEEGVKATIESLGG
jgi:ADP-L-glycero-D-manno-heptose 6-epimerase